MSFFFTAADAYSWSLVCKFCLLLNYGRTIIFSSCGFFFFSFLSFFPRLISAVADWMSVHTSTHGVALVRISDAGLKRAARSLLQIQDANNRNHRTTLSGYIFATKARIDNRKNF